MHLMACALREVPVKPVPGAVSLSAVLSLAQSNSVATTCAFAAVDVASGEEEKRVWQAEIDRNLFRIANFEMEREGIFADMRDVGLSWLPLKGSVIGRVYPRPEMRWMCDNDILFGIVESNDKGGFEAFDEERAARAMRRIMEARGFIVASFGMGNHDSYEKAPFFNFEMHRGLANSSNSWWRYYENPWSRAKIAQDSSGAVKADSFDDQESKAARQASAQGCAFEFSHEDVYLFHIAHMYKHFSSAGCGVRGIADEWVLLSAWGSQLNWEYIEAELDKLGMASFEQDVRRVAKRVIGDDACGRALGLHAASDDAEALASEDAAFVAYMLGSGTYGTIQNVVENKIRENEQKGSGNARLRYLAQRAFPSAEQLKQGYPILKKRPWALPAVYAYRLTVKPFLRRKRLSAELRAVAKQREEGER